jgi:hypothetical protein
MWFAGANLFSSCLDETEEEQRRAWAARGLDEYSRIKPYHPPQEDFCEESDSRRPQTTRQLGSELFIGFSDEPPKHHTTITRDNIDALSFGILRTLYEAYCCDQPEHVVPIEDVIAALPTVRRALQQSGSWEGLMDIIHGGESVTVATARRNRLLSR